MRRIFIVSTLFLAACCLMLGGCHPRADQSVHGQPATQLSALDWFLRGNNWYENGDPDRAIADYDKALEIDPHCVVAYNNKAWLLATCPDGEYRNGAKAVDLALKAVELNPDVYQLDTLAAAYAEAGKFEDAITIQERVIGLFNKEGDTEALAESIERLRYYEAHEPWRETASRK